MEAPRIGGLGAKKLQKSIVKIAEWKPPELGVGGKKLQIRL